MPTECLDYGSIEPKLEEIAVTFRKGFKHYGRKSSRVDVLKGLDMTVRKGTIYGLLGASGCGKTTLLTCVIGRLFLNSGKVVVLGETPGTRGSSIPGRKIGYMPQETSLYLTFSIRETLLFFGRVNGISCEDIISRMNHLLKVLELPDESSIIGELSGGQQRRVSLLVALIHDPELLILDEPTVGVDPILKHSIWQYMLDLVKNTQKTVIVTTHYIQEAVQAHTIGLMRGGVLLAEESPSLVISKFHCESLEQVFLLLSRKQEGIVNYQNPQIMESDNLHKNSQDFSDFTENKADDLIGTCGGPLDISLKRMNVLLWKNLIWMKRYFTVVVFALLIAPIQTIIFCLSVGQTPTNLKLAVVNEDFAQENFTFFCDPSYSQLMGNCTFTHLSCKFIDHLNSLDIIHWEVLNSLSEAQTLAMEGQVWGIVYFNRNYSAAIRERILFNNDYDDILEDSQIRVWLDMSNHPIANILKYGMILNYFSFMKDVFSGCDYNVQFIDMPVRFNHPIYGDERSTFTEFVAPGVIVTMVFMLGILLSAGVILMEKAEGLVERGLASGVLMSEVILSHIIIQTVIMTAQVLSVLFICFGVFQIPHLGSMWWVILLAFLQGFAGMSFGFAVAVACDNMTAASYFCIGSFYPIILLSGMAWPIEALPILLKYLGMMLPLTCATESMRSMLLRGWGVTRPTVYYGFITSFAWIAILLALTFIILKYRK